jgi:ligand-binding sensor domain-containing protein/signal transduction histidine kinase
METALYAWGALSKMPGVVMRRISSSLAVGLAGISFLVSPAQGFDSGLTETEGAIRTWRSDQGLPSDSVSAIIQTRDGFLWVGTGAGLVRFDGVKFTEVDLGQLGTNALTRVTALCEDSRGHLWIGTQTDGLFQLADGVVTQFTRARGLLDDNVTSLAAGGDGNVWIGTRSGLNLSTGTEIKSFTVRDGLTDDLVSGLHVARSGTVWITTRGGMCRYVDGHIAPYALQTESQGRSPEYLGAYEDRRGNLWAFGDTYLINLAEGKRFNYFRGNEATSVRIWSLCEGRDGRLWIGTSGRGLFCFDDNRFQPVILGELRWPYDVRAICEDHEGNLWLGTSGGGLVQLRPQPVHVMRTGQGLPASSPTALALDAGGRVHVGMQRGGLFVGEAGRFERFGSASGLEIQDFISSVGVARDGTVWAGTLGGGLYGLRSGRRVRYTTANGLADDSVLSVCVDREGSVWASTAAGTVHRFTATNATRFDTTRGLPGTPVTVLIPAIAGGLWLGTEDGAVWREEKGKFLVVQSGDKVGYRPVLALHEGEAEQLWIGTTGGLSYWQQGARMSWSTGSGLPSDYIAGIVTDTAKNLWLATGAGVYRISQDILQKSLADSLTPLVCKQMSDARTASESTAVFGGNRALFSTEGKLWFATSEGVLNVDTRRPEIEAASLPLYLESVTFNSELPVSLLRSAAWAAPAMPATTMIAPGNLGALEIHYTALSFTAPEKTRFRHRLEGSDSDWVDDGTARFVKYFRLPYGRYRFHLAARQADGPWQEAATTFAFEVPTPLYLQSWAIGLYGVVAIALVTGIVRVVSHRRLRFALAQLEQQQSLERERMRIARDMHDEIGSKLTKISFLSEHARMDAKSEGPLAGKIQAIAESSRELLQTMDEIVWVVNPRNDTLEHLAAYLSHYAEEYFQNTTVECELRLPQAIGHFPLSSETRHNLFLAFEETLNNVLKHARASRVKVEMILNAPKFGVVVTDNGCGFETTGAPVNGQGPGPRGGRVGNGLKNLRQRLADIGGECEIRSQTGAGTTVSMFIRLPRNSANKS